MSSLAFISSNGFVRSAVPFLFPPPFTIDVANQSVNSQIFLLSILSYSLSFLLQIANMEDSTEDLGASERETAGSKGGQEGTESCDSSVLFQNCVLKWNFSSL